MKTTKLKNDIEKTRAKIAELQAKLRDQERVLKETENSAIIELVRTIDATPEEVAVMLRAMREAQKQEAMKSLAPQFEDETDETEDDAEAAEEQEVSDYEG